MCSRLPPVSFTGTVPAVRVLAEMASTSLEPLLVASQRVRLSGLVSRPELNGVCGSVLRHDQAKGRYAIKLDNGSESILAKRENLILELDAGSRAARRATLSAHVARQHTLQIEGSTHVSAVAAAKSRSELSDEVWDRVVEIQREVQVCCNACESEFPALMLEAIQADDAACWSRTSVIYAHYLLGQVRGAGVASSSSKMEPSMEGKRLATRVLQIHGCQGRCRDAMLAAALLTAGGPLSPQDAESLLCTATEACSVLHRDEWERVKERDAMQRELQEHWDRDTATRIRKESAE